jgi:NAD(P)-dependent dehydrogenase (short-subunit alcohol dehydrogenase family)
MYSFEGSRILIAGGSSGIGFAAARLLASLGGEIIIASRSAGKLGKALALIKGNITALEIDAEDRAGCGRALEKIGNFDHLVLTLSGGKGGGPFRALEPLELRQAFETKFWGYLSLAQQSLPYLPKTGSITFVTAVSARAANPGTAGLSAVNAAIEGLVRPLAVELSPLRVNAVSPGVIDTPWWDVYEKTARESFFRQMSALTPVRRIGRPEDVAESIVFLLGNTFMSGTVIECDGGLHLVSSSL